MDTDSLLYEIRTENLIKDMIEAPINFDMVDVLTPEILQNLGSAAEQHEILTKYKKLANKPV